MGHHLHAFFARPDVLAALPIPELRRVHLPQGFAMAPIPEEIAKRFEDDDNPGPLDTLVLPGPLADIALKTSINGSIVWLESDWFGGSGENRCVLWREGKLVRPNPGFNEALEILGVVRASEPVDPGWLAKLGRMLDDRSKPRLLDAWDTLGLGDYRDTERAYEAGTPIEPIRGG